MSNATTQTIWQIQISGCITHCRGTRQSQAAGQQSISVQVVRGAAPRGATSVRVIRRHSAAVAHRPAIAVIRHRGITQIQIGCRSHCVDSTTSGSAIPNSVRRIVQQLLHGTAEHSRPDGSAQGTNHNAVNQTIHQQQRGQVAARSQTEQSSQTSITVQTIQLSRSLRAQLAAALSSTVGSAVSQTEQAIWQLQIGCLSYCSRTRQHQRAAQATASIQVVPPAPKSRAAQPARAVAAVSTVTQLIWQLQIGCLFWCYRATESQAATHSAHTVQITSGAFAPKQSSTSSVGSVEVTSEAASVAIATATVVGSTGRPHPPRAPHRTAGTGRASTRANPLAPRRRARADGVSRGSVRAYPLVLQGRLLAPTGESVLGFSVVAAMLVLLAAALALSAGARALYVRRVQGT